MIPDTVAAVTVSDMIHHYGGDRLHDDLDGQQVWVYQGAIIKFARKERVTWEQFEDIALIQMALHRWEWDSYLGDHRIA